MPKHLRLILALGVMLSIATASCARRVEVPALPTDVQKTIATISEDKTLQPAQKEALMREVIASTERVYQRIIERQENQGKNVKDTVLQFFAIAASIATLIWGVK